MAEPDWIRKDTVLALHNRQLAEHGGAEGVRDENLLESALARPLNIYSYGEAHHTSIPALGAAYAYGIATNHPFFDGNKRVALVTSQLFLRLNGYRLQTTQEDKYKTFIALAAGDINEAGLREWFETHASQTDSES